MNYVNEILKLLNKVYRSCPFVSALVNATAYYLNKIYLEITKIRARFYFDLLDSDGVLYWEELLNITPGASQSLDDRKSTIQARWYSNIHNDITLLQKICDSWKNGEVVVSFVNGKLKLTFCGQYGVPEDISTLLSSFECMKPAHLGYDVIYKYLLIRDIHNVKTIAQMETLTINQFAMGKE